MELDDNAAVALKVKNHRGREAVFDAAYARYKDPMMELCWRVTGNWADGEDAFQNAMVSVYKGLGGFKGKARFSTWLYRVCLQSALRVRSRSKRKTVDLPPDAYTPEGPNRTELARRIGAYIKGDESVARRHPTGAAPVRAQGVGPRRDRRAAGYSRRHGLVAAAPRQKTTPAAATHKFRY